MPSGGWTKIARELRPLGRKSVYKMHWDGTKQNTSKNPGKIGPCAPPPPKTTIAKCAAVMRKLGLVFLGLGLDCGRTVRPEFSFRPILDIGAGDIKSDWETLEGCTRM